MKKIFFYIKKSFSPNLKKMLKKSNLNRNKAKFYKITKKKVVSVSKDRSNS